MSSLYANAILEVLLLGVLSGLVGTVVLLRRRAFFTVALTHATFPGGVIAVLLSVPVLVGAGVVSVALVGLMTVISRVRRQGSQVASGVILTSGFALGMLLESLNPSLPVQVDSFLVGSVLTVSDGQVAATGVVLAVTTVVFALAGKELLFSTFDQWGFRAAGYSEAAVDAVALGLIAASVVVAMPAVGSILAIALLVGPAAAARALSDDLRVILPLASTFGVAAGLIGLWLSRTWGIAAGGAISLTAAAIFVVATGVGALRTRARHSRVGSAPAERPSVALTRQG